MKVLVIEDSLAMGKALSEILIRQGHQVTWLTGVKTLEPLAGTVHGGNDLSLNFDDFDFLIEDGELKGSAYQGVEIVNHASALLHCIGFSSQPEFNQKMVNNGAVFGAKKPVLLVALEAGVLKLEEAVAQQKEISLLLADYDQTMPKNPQFSQPWQRVEQRLRELMKEEFGI
jgi:CheY-like chemotaxis protein